MKELARVLVVDDNEDLLNTFALILKRKGYLVDTAENGMAALNKYSLNHFDIVLMDVVMPCMDGIEALHKIQEINPEAKVILVTAYYEEQQMQNILNEGACGALYKPVNITQLMELIGDLLEDSPILVVDDDSALRENAASILGLHGYRVITAASGEQAIMKARQKPFKLAIIDIVMPDMDGVSTAQKLKEINPNLHVIMMTGYRDEVKEILSEAAGSGFSKCLFKPFRGEELSELVTQVI